MGNGNKNVAFLANASVAQSKKLKSNKNVECYDCGKKGHMKADCWENGSEKEGQSLHAKKNMW